MEWSLFISTDGMYLTNGALKSERHTKLETKVCGSNIIGLKKLVGPVPLTYNGFDAHRCHSTNFQNQIKHICIKARKWKE